MSNNLIILFFCWELVGLCSYLLISFWKERQHSLKCSFKAILYNKVGDIGLLLSFGSTLEVIRTIDLVPGITVLPYFKSLGHYYVNYFTVISFS